MIRLYKRAVFFRLLTFLAIPSKLSLVPRSRRPISRTQRAKPKKPSLQNTRSYIQTLLPLRAKFHAYWNPLWTQLVLSVHSFMDSFFPFVRSFNGWFARSLVTVRLFSCGRYKPSLSSFSRLIFVRSFVQSVRSFSSNLSEASSSLSALPW